MNTQTNAPKTLQIVNIIAFVAVLVFNGLANTTLLNGRTTSEVSDALPSYFTPAGYTFSIWGVIYLGLLGFIIYQALPAQRHKPFMQQIGWLFALSSFFNVVWLLCWHYDYLALTLVMMLGILLTLIAIYLRLNIGHPHPDRPLIERLLVQLPFSLYLGWITVATIANIASVINKWGWDGFGIAEPTWSAIMMVVAAIVAGLLLFNRRNLPYAAVLVWALFGIRAAYPSVPIVANTAVVAAALIILCAIVGYVRTRPVNNTSDTQPRTA